MSTAEGIAYLHYMSPPGSFATGRSTPRVLVHGRETPFGLVVSAGKIAALRHGDRKLEPEQRVFIPGALAERIPIRIWRQRAVRQKTPRTQPVTRDLLRTLIYREIYVRE